MIDDIRSNNETHSNYNCLQMFFVNITYILSVKNSILLISNTINLKYVLPIE